MEIAIIAFDGADEFDVIGPYEVFQHAAGCMLDVNVRIVTLDGNNNITAGHGLRYNADARLDGPVHLLVVPGGGWVNRAPKGVRAEIAQGVLPTTIALEHKRGVRIAAVCTGTMAVAASGILGNRPATTHRGAFEDLRAAGAQVIDARVVDDGDIVSCGGVTSGLDLSLWLVEQYWGQEISERVATYIEHQRSDSVWVRPSCSGVKDYALFAS